MADNILKVDTRQLKQTADEVRSRIRAIGQDLDGMQTVVGRSSYYWQGQAADEYRQAVAEQKEPAAEMIRRLSAIPAALETIAGVYEQTESGNVDLAGALKTDYI